MKINKILGIVLLFICLVFSVNAIVVDSGVTYTDTGALAAGGRGCLIIYPNEDLTLNSITKASIDQGTIARVYYASNKSLVGGWSFIGDTATTSGETLYKGIKYYVCSLRTTSWTHAFNVGFSFPTNTELLNYTGGLYYDGSNWVGEPGTTTARSIQSIDVTSTSPEPSGDLSFINITLNDRDFINHSYFNTSDITLSTFLEVTNENENVNVTYKVNNYTPYENQFITNSLNGSINFNKSTGAGLNKFVRFEPSVNGVPQINGSKIGYSSGFGFNATDTAQAFCNMVLDSDRSLTGTSFTTNESAYFWNGTNFFFESNVEFLNYITLTDCEIFADDGTWFLDIFAFNNETSVNYTGNHFHIDSTPANLSFNNNTEFNDYTFNISLLNISCQDDNLRYCAIYWDDGNITNSTTGNFTENKTFSTNGNHSFTIDVWDLAGNHFNETGQLLINPRIFFYVNETTLLSDFTFGGRGSVNNAVNYTVYNDGLTFGNNTLEFVKSGYVTTDFTFNVNTTMPTNITFQVQKAQININIYDQITGDLVVGENFTLTLVGDVGYTTSTTTGTKNIEGILLTNSDYRLVVTSTNYDTENEFFTFNNAEILNLSIFVIESNDTNNGFVILQVLDTDGAPIESAIVQAKQWDVDTSSYISVSEDKTGSDGNGEVNIVLNDKIYIFTATLGEFNTQSPEYIITDANNGRTIVLTLILETAFLPDFDFENVITNVTEVFNNVTNTSTVTFIWDNQLGTDITGCVNAYRIQNYKEILLQTDCTTAESATKIKSYVLDLSSYDYVIKAEFLVDGNYYVVDEFKHYKTGNIFNILKNYKLHYILYMFLTILSVWSGVKLNSIPVGGIMLILSALTFVSIDPSLFTASVGGLLTFIGFMILWGASR